MGWSKASRVWPLARWQSRPRPGSRTQPAAATTLPSSERFRSKRWTRPSS